MCEPRLGKSEVSSPGKLERQRGQESQSCANQNECSSGNGKECGGEGGLGSAEQKNVSQPWRSEDEVGVNKSHDQIRPRSHLEDFCFASPGEEITSSPKSRPDFCVENRLAWPEKCCGIKSFAALAEGWSGVPSAHVRQLTAAHHCSSRNLTPFLGSSGICTPACP